MPDKARKRPVKPIAAETVKPQGIWRPGSFKEAAKAEQAVVAAQVLEQMRAALQPQLEQELAQLRQQAEKEGYEAGHQEGYEVGYQAGKAEALAELEKEKQALIASHQQLIESLTESLSAPLEAWDETLLTALGALMVKSLKALMAADPEHIAHFFRQQLKQALPQWRQKKIPFTIRAHPQWQALLTELLPENKFVTIEIDEQLPETRIEVTQEATLEVLDWQMMVDTFTEQLMAQFPSAHENTSSDTPFDSAAE